MNADKQVKRHDKNIKLQFPAKLILCEVFLKMEVYGNNDNDVSYLFMAT